MSGAAAKPDAFSDHQIILTAYAFIGVTSAFALARIALHWLAPRRPTYEDGLVFFAWICDVAMCSLYISLARPAQRLSNFKQGLIPMYPTVREDGRYVSRLYFCAPLLFWMLLWSIKLSFLLLYRKLLDGLPMVYTYMWWFIVFMCVAVSVHRFELCLSKC